MKKFIVVLMVLWSIVMAGCSKDKGDKAKSEEEKQQALAEAKKAEPVVKIGNGIISVGDATNFIQSRPMKEQGKSARELLDKYLNDMIDEEVLYQEAIHLKIDQDPRLKSTIRRMLIQKLMDDQVNNKLWKSDVEQSLLQQYYEKFHDDFNRPEQVRLADIFIAIPQDATEEKKAELKKKAETVLVEVKQEVQNRNGIGPLIQKYSDTNIKYSKGDTGFFDIEGKPIGIDKNLVEEAFKLEKTGDISDHVIETPDGFHIILLTGKRSAINRPIQEVENFLKQRIRQEELPKLSKEYTEGLKKKAKIQIDQQKADEILKEIEGSQEENQVMPKESQIPDKGQTNSPPSLPARNE